MNGTEIARISRRRLLSGIMRGVLGYAGFTILGCAPAQPRIAALEFSKIAIPPFPRNPGPGGYIGEGVTSDESQRLLETARSKTAEETRYRSAFLPYEMSLPAGAIAGPRDSRGETFTDPAGNVVRVISDPITDPTAPREAYVSKVLLEMAAQSLEKHPLLGDVKTISGYSVFSLVTRLRAGLTRTVIFVDDAKQDRRGWWISISSLTAPSNDVLPQWILYSFKRT